MSGSDLAASQSSAGRSLSQGHAYDRAKDGEPKFYSDVLYDYEAQRDEELTVRSGDEVGVLQPETFTGWMMCCLHGRAGLVPSNFLERFQQHTIRITEFDTPTKPPRTTPMQGDAWSAKLQAADAEVRQLQESLASQRQEVEKALGERTVPLSATDSERIIYDLIKLGMLLEEDSDELSDFGQRLRHAWDELKNIKGDIKTDLSAVPQLGHFRQQIVKNLSQLTSAMRDQEAARRDMQAAVDECLNSLVSLRVHMEGRRRDKGDEESSSTSSRGGSSINVSTSK